MVISLLPPQKFAIRTWFCNCPQYLCFHIIGPWGNVCANFPQNKESFQQLQQRFWIHTYFYKCPQYLCLFDILVEYNISKRCQRTMFVLPNQSLFKSTFHIGSMFCFFPASFVSSTYTDKNSPFSRLTNTHFQFGTFSQPCCNRTFSNCLSHDGPAGGWKCRFRSRGTTGSIMLNPWF